ncbi:MAG: acetyl-CoA carboxylase carboxyl transferase subunit alpha, partial [Treponema sp.]|nr:acetyl-CoA carboxylase carboxyl transferase subunit alpha [Treponema sp.]
MNTSLLQTKIDELKELIKKSGIETSGELEQLENKIQANSDIEIIWKQVELARHPERPYSLDYIGRIFDDFTELHGDRAAGDDAAIVGGLAF